MTNDQCIEIAEKVWGWEKETDQALLLHYPKDEIVLIEPGDSVPVGSYFTVDRLKELVNSWQGFGRTVEAMAKLTNEKMRKTIFFLKLSSIIVCWVDKKESIEELFKATHLAALEALK